jgi:hypothetical protein
MAAGQGAGTWPGVAVMRAFVLDGGADSCELVLFMLMVFPSCEGHHVWAGEASPYCGEAKNRNLF